MYVAARHTQTFSPGSQHDHSFTLGDVISWEQEPLDATMSHMCPGASTKYWSNHSRAPSLETVPKK